MGQSAQQGAPRNAADDIPSFMRHGPREIAHMKHLGLIPKDAPKEGPSRLMFGIVTISWVLALLALALPYVDIDAVRSSGSDQILWLQDQGVGLRQVSRIFSYLGDDIAYIAVLPMLVWLSPTVGMRAFILFFISLFLNSILKTLLHAPRPSWVSTAGFVCEIEYGNPSGHAQNAFALFLFGAFEVTSYISGGCQHVVVWMAAVVLAALVAASRTVIGAHFPHQVLGGALVGVALCPTFLAAVQADSLVAALRSRTNGVGSSVLFAVMLTFVGCGISIVAWGITEASFDLPPSWVARAEQSCIDENEKIDEFGSTRYAFFATGILASSAVVRGAGALSSMVYLDGLKMWQRLVAGVVTVLVAAVLYFGVGAAVSKDWHIALVLILRYYLRGLLVGLAALWLVPSVWRMSGWCTPEPLATASPGTEMAT